MFRDRPDAGLRLAWELGHCRDRKDALVLAIPRGGMPVGAALARELDLPLHAMLIGRLEHPEDRRVQVGAVGLTELELEPRAGVDGEYLAAAVEQVRAVLHRRYWSYREVLHPAPVEGRIVLLTDDEAGSGLSLAAAARRLRREGAARIVIAVPAATREALEGLRRAADEVVCLRAVGDAEEIASLYRDFSPVSEEQALAAFRREATGAQPR